MGKQVTPEITIVIPVYNVEQYIDRCLQSVLKQSFKKFEVILVDDGSPDHCGEICDRYKEIFNDRNIPCVVIHQKNGGLSAARNSGIEWANKNSRSNWITFIDSDDWLHSDYLKLLYDAAIHTNTSISVGMYDKVTVVEDDQVLDQVGIQLMSPEKLWVERRTNATVAWGKLYKRAFFLDQCYPIGRYHEDEYVTYKLLFQCSEISFVPIPIYHYFYNENSISRLGYMKRLPDILEALNFHLEFLSPSVYKDAYRLEVETYAGALSDAIWLSGKNDSDEVTIKKLREELIEFLKNHKKEIPFYKRKDIYIAAYPSQKIWIRAFGFLLKNAKR